MGKMIFRQKDTESNEMRETTKWNDERKLDTESINWNHEVEATNKRIWNCCNCFQAGQKEVRSSENLWVNFHIKMHLNRYTFFQNLMVYIQLKVTKHFWATKLFCG